MVSLLAWCICGCLGWRHDHNQCVCDVEVWYWRSLVCVCDEENDGRTPALIARRERLCGRRACADTGQGSRLLHAHMPADDAWRCHELCRLRTALLVLL